MSHSTTAVFHNSGISKLVSNPSSAKYLTFLTSHKCNNNGGNAKFLVNLPPKIHINHVHRVEELSWCSRSFYFAVMKDGEARNTDLRQSKTNQTKVKRGKLRLRII